MICAELPQSRNQELSYPLLRESFRAVNRYLARELPGLLLSIVWFQSGRTPI